MSEGSGNDFLRREREVQELLDRVPAETIGARLQRARKRQGLSIRDLAAAANVNKNSIVRLEKGGIPQPLTVLKICAALGLHVASIANPGKEEGEPVALHRRADDAWFDMTELGAGPIEGSRDHIAAPMSILQSRLGDGMIMPTLIELYGETHGQPMMGEEMVYVLKGRLLLTVGARDYELEEGESATFWSSEQHAYRPADGAELPVRLLCVSVLSGRKA